MTKTLDQIEVAPNGTIFFNEISTVDEEIVSRHRWSLIPGSDTTGLPEEIVTLCDETWTPEVIAAFKASIQASLPQPNTEAA